jgi:hypothetical protein
MHCFRKADDVGSNPIGGSTFIYHNGGIGVMVAPQFVKLNARVQFPYVTPFHVVVAERLKAAACKAA